MIDLIQMGMSAIVTPKIQTIPRFKNIKQMWVGADFNNDTLWQWRGYYKSFTGDFIYFH